MANKDKYNIT